LCTHLSVHPEDRALQTEALLSISDGLRGPALLLADLNDTPESGTLSVAHSSRLV
jgi:endonuclease/exonuclease/phosphatase family metal-dependent hydrolase